MARRHAVFSLEEQLTQRLRAYARALESGGAPVTLSGLVEAALCEYLDRRCAHDGALRPGQSALPRPGYPGPGRPSAAVRASRYVPDLRRIEGGRRPREMRRTTR